MDTFHAPNSYAEQRLVRSISRESQSHTVQHQIQKLFALAQPQIRIPCPASVWFRSPDPNGQAGHHASCAAELVGLPAPSVLSKELNCHDDEGPPHTLPSSSPWTSSYRCDGDGRRYVCEACGINQPTFDRSHIVAKCRNLIPAPTPSRSARPGIITNGFPRHALNCATPDEGVALSGLAPRNTDQLIRAPSAWKRWTFSVLIERWIA
jgi:hypothetical protein